MNHGAVKERHRSNNSSTKQKNLRFTCFFFFFYSQRALGVCYGTSHWSTLLLKLTDQYVKFHLGICLHFSQYHLSHLLDWLFTDTTKTYCFGGISAITLALTDCLIRHRAHIDTSVFPPRYKSEPSFVDLPPYRCTCSVIYGREKIRCRWKSKRRKMKYKVTSWKCAG